MKTTRPIQKILVWKKEREILEVKRKRNISLPEVRNLVNTFMKKQTYANSKTTSTWYKSPLQIQNTHRKTELRIKRLDKNHLNN